jgi:hypothetical protein
LSRDPHSRGFELGVARFEITTNCEESCVLAVAGLDRHVTMIPMSSQTHDLRGKDFIYHLDGIRDGSRNKEFDEGFKHQTMQDIGDLYKALFRYAILATLLLVVYRVARISARRRGRGFTDHVVLATAVGFSVTGLVLILSIIATYSFPTFNSEYTGAMMPPLLLSCALSLATEVTLAFRFLRRRLPNPEGPPRPS